MNKLGSSALDFRICLDTGCGLTTFYMDMDILKVLYPDIQDANITVDMTSADGVITNNLVHIIPNFYMTDNDGKRILIKDLHCVVSSARMKKIDVLLSGNIFCSAGLTIIPQKDKHEIAKRYIIIDTLDDNRCILIMKPLRNSNGKIRNEPSCAFQDFGETLRSRCPVFGVFLLRCRRP